MKLKKTIVCMLTLAMALSAVPASAHAEGAKDPVSTETVIGSKLSQNIRIEKRNRTVRYNLLEAGSRTLKVLTVSDAKTELTFDKVEGAGYFKVAKKTGKITVGRGTPVGTYSVKIKVSAKASAEYRSFTKNVTVNITVKPGIQPITVTANHQTVPYSKVKNSSVTVKNTMTVEGAVGKVTYKKVSGTDYITVNEKTGAITVKKGTPKSTGTYRIGVKVTAAGNKNYKAAVRNRTLRVTVS